MTLREILATNLRKMRQERGVSQGALMYAAGINRTYISALERCRYAATVDVLERVAHALGVNPYVLLRTPS